MQIRTANTNSLRRLKRNFDFFNSLNIFGTTSSNINSGYEEEEEEDEQNELNDFLSFLYSNSKPTIGSTLENKTKSVNITNRTDNGLFDLSYQSDELPVALIQLLIILLVFLILFFLCKCNLIMEYLREKLDKLSSDDDDDIYKDHKTFWDYIESFWYDFKMKRRLRKRRKRRKLKNQGSIGRNRSYAFKSKRNNSTEGSVYRNNSAIFKRRSAIYRNNRKQRNTESFNSMTSFNKSRNKPNQYRNTNYSFTSSLSSPKKMVNFDSTDIKRTCSQGQIDEIV